MVRFIDCCIIRNPITENLKAPLAIGCEFRHGFPFFPAFRPNITWQIVVKQGYVRHNLVLLANIQNVLVEIDACLDVYKRQDDLLDEADLIFRYDWACVDARIKGEPAPAGLNSEVVYERHWGLNWLIDADGQNDWDLVSCNT